MFSLCFVLYSRDRAHVPSLFILDFSHGRQRRLCKRACQCFVPSQLLFAGLLPWNRVLRDSEVCPPYSKRQRQTHTYTTGEREVWLAADHEQHFRALQLWEVLLSTVPAGWASLTTGLFILIGFKCLALFSQSFCLKAMLLSCCG